MKKRALLILVLLFAGRVSAQESYRFDHGPYLQGLTENSVHIYFTTSAKGFSKVELRRAGSGETVSFVTVDDGLIEANNTMNAIRVDRLDPATGYEYRLVSRKIVDFQPYHVVFGDSIVSPWYRFRTLDPAAETAAFIPLSDIHDDNEKYRALLSCLPLDSAQMVFLVGDNINYIHREDQPYTGFIDTSVELFATEKPFVVVRGNHETRGHLARNFPRFVYRPDGHYYGFYRIGNTAVVMLDSGEDKPDTHPVYAGLVAFDGYRQQQREWLEGIVESDEYRNAAHRIVMVHIPPIDQAQVRDEYLAGGTDHGTQQVYDLFVPLLRDAGVDLMISGHTHRSFFFDKGEGGLDFPLIINDNKSASYIRVTPQGIAVRTVDREGNLTFSRMF